MKGIVKFEVLSPGRMGLHLQIRSPHTLLLFYKLINLLNRFSVTRRYLSVEKEHVKYPILGCSKRGLPKLRIRNCNL